MSAPPSTISVIIPTHNRVDLLVRALRRLAAARGYLAGDEVVVVANACIDGTQAAVDELRGGFPVELRICAEGNPNLNAARNRGASEAHGDLLAFIDDDVLVEDGWIDAVRASFDDRGADIVTGPVELCWELVQKPEWLTQRAAKLLTTIDLGPDVIITRNTNHFVGANLAMRSRLWRDLGGFRAGLDRSGQDLLSGGDTEFVGRALEMGQQGIYHPRARVRHLVTPRRATMDYLAAVAEGRGRTRVALSRLGSSHHPLLLVRYGAAQLVVGAWWRLYGLAAGSRTRTVDGLLVSRRGWGTLRALISPPVSASGQV